MDVKNMTDEQLVNNAVSLDKTMKQDKKRLDSYKAELQARGLRLLEDQNVKYMKFYSQDGTAAVMDSMTLEILNIDKLKELITEGVYKTKVKETTETKYKIDSKLEKALKAIFTGDYDFSYTLEEFIDEMSIRPDAKQKKLLLRRLKGEYEKDKETLNSVLGFKEDNPLDVELWFIYKIKNAELIKAFFPEEGIDYTMEQIKKCIIVDTKTSITIDYEKED